MEDLNTSFRDLVKKYHPDKVRDHPEWAHERMAEINDAYETLAEWISAPPQADSTPAGVDETEPRTPPSRPDPQDPFESLHRREYPPLPKTLESRFYAAFHAFLDGLGLYYQYGLDKASYREEGVRRFRFREAFRQTEKARNSLEELSKEYSHHAVKAASRFARLCVADMDLGEPTFQPGPPEWKSFDRRLRKARRDFDAVVREIFFPELVPQHLHGRSVPALYSCYTEFVLYLSVFSEGERRKAGILQTARYDAFMDLMELRSEGIIRF